MQGRIRIEARRNSALDRLAPALAAAGTALGRLRRVDLVPNLIATIDALERSAKAVWRALCWLAPRRALRLTGALAWRLAAALAGVGCTAALITGLSAKDEDQPAAISAVVQSAALAQSGTPQPVSSGPIQWTPVIRPIAMFNLDAPELARAAPAYAARSGSGAREDLLSFGSLPQATPHLVLAIRTGRLDGARSLPFTVALAREAATMALSTTRSAMPVTIDTRFGSLETADVVLSDGTEARGCIAFRSTGEAQGFTLRGWWCAAGKPSDRRQLTCLIERLDLVSAAADQDLRAAFAASELRRTPACERPHLSAAGRKASWLDADAAAPALKAKTVSAEPAKAVPTPRKKPAQLRARTAARDLAST